MLEEIQINRQRIEETSNALKVAEGKEREALEILMDTLQDNEDMLLSNLK